VEFSWLPTAGWEGPVQATLQITLLGNGAQRQATAGTVLELVGPREQALCFGEPVARRESDGSWRIQVQASNIGAEPLETPVRAFVVQAAWPLPEEYLRLQPGEEQELSWTVPPQASDLYEGTAEVRIYAPAYEGATAKAEIVLRRTGGE
jgi:hypothetical protein